MHQHDEISLHHNTDPSLADKTELCVTNGYIPNHHRHSKRSVVAMIIKELFVLIGVESSLVVCLLR